LRKTGHTGNIKNQGLGQPKILDAFETSSMVHFAGHSFDTGEPDSTGLLIGPDTVLNLTEIEKMSTSPSVPWLIF
jgi:hypothetical protein